MSEKTYRGASLRERLIGFRRKLAIVLVGVLSLVMAYHVLFGHDGVIAYQQKRNESRELQQQIQQLQQENQTLQKQVKALKDDPEAIEKEARERLRYARPGEVIYTLPAAKPAPSRVPAK